jgi:hypothetical protein
MTLTFDVGYASNPDALADGIDGSTAGQINFTSGTMPDDALTPTALASTDTTIVAKVASLTGVLIADTKAVFHLAYKMPA